MTRPLLLDLFCGAGGAAMGYYRAGFDVVGVDLTPQPRYPFEFHLIDALAVLRKIASGYRPWNWDLAAIHASPPCQAYSATRTMWNNPGGHPDLVEPTRRLLLRSGHPWVMENVPGAPLMPHVVLCGSMFGLEIPGYQLRRHRLFETSGFHCLTPQCQHRGRAMGVYGNGGSTTQDPENPKGVLATISQARRLMGIDWMTTREIAQAIPPAYTEHIGAQLLDYLRAAP